MLNVEIICPACGKDTLLNRKPIYEGFAKTRDELSCTSCGHIFESENTVPFKEQPTEPLIFTDDDRIQTPALFETDENRTLCRHCANYLINPFMQYCSTRKAEVQATDSCNLFEEKNERLPAQ